MARDPDGQAVTCGPDVHRCAFLTMESLEAFVSDDELVYGPLRSLGWEVKAVPWRTPGVDWTAFAAVISRARTLKTG
jgi:hypothetical protein